MTPNRYAIYFVPNGDTAWARFCTSWLGWDIATGQAVPHPKLSPARPISAITAVPRRYGVHATLKPPFRLRTGKTPQALKRAAFDLAETLPPVTIDELALTRLGRFLALTARVEAKPLNDMAARLVRDLDGFRAPASDQELERRRAGGLSPQQEANLRNWGYPHVMDQFRFHMTLTGKLPKDDLGQVQTLLETYLVPDLPRPLVIDRLALVGEDDDGFFHLIEHLPLAGG